MANEEYREDDVHLDDEQLDENIEFDDYDETDDQLHEGEEPENSEEQDETTSEDGKEPEGSEESEETGTEQDQEDDGAKLLKALIYHKKKEKTYKKQLDSLQSQLPPQIQSQAGMPLQPGFPAAPQTQTTPAVPIVEPPAELSPIEKYQQSEEYDPDAPLPGRVQVEQAQWEKKRQEYLVYQQQQQQIVNQIMADEQASMLLQLAGPYLTQFDYAAIAADRNPVYKAKMLAAIAIHNSGNQQLMRMAETVLDGNSSGRTKSSPKQPRSQRPKKQFKRRYEPREFGENNRTEIQFHDKVSELLFRD